MKMLNKRIIRGKFAVVVLFETPEGEKKRWEWGSVYNDKGRSLVADAMERAQTTQGIDKIVKAAGWQYDHDHTKNGWPMVWDCQPQLSKVRTVIDHVRTELEIYCHLDGKPYKSILDAHNSHLDWLQAREAEIKAAERAIDFRPKVIDNLVPAVNMTKQHKTAIQRHAETANRGIAANLDATLDAAMALIKQDPLFRDMLNIPMPSRFTGEYRRKIKRVLLPLLKFKLIHPDKMPVLQAKSDFSNLKESKSEQRLHRGRYTELRLGGWLIGHLEYFSLTDEKQHPVLFYDGHGDIHLFRDWQQFKTALPKTKFRLIHDEGPYPHHDDRYYYVPDNKLDNFRLTSPKAIDLEYFRDYDLERWGVTNATQTTD